MSEVATQFDRAAAVQQLRDRVNETMVSKLENFSVETIVDNIVTQLRKNQQEVTWKILGLDNKWGGKWEVDHCNGRISPLSSEIAQHAQPMLAQLVGELVREVVQETATSPKARADLKEAMRKEVDKKLGPMLREAVMNASREIVDTTVKSIVAEVRAEAGL